MKEKPPVELKFSVVPAQEAIAWISSRNFGRFAELKRNLVDQLQTLRRKECLTIPMGENKKENDAMITAMKSAVKRNKLRWMVRYAPGKKCVVVVHQAVYANRKEQK